MIKLLCFIILLVSDYAIVLLVDLLVGVLELLLLDLPLLEDLLFRLLWRTVLTLKAVHLPELGGKVNVWAVGGVEDVVHKFSQYGHCYLVIPGYDRFKHFE